MKRRASWWIGLGFTFGLAGLFLTFQNCTVAAPGSEKDLSSIADKAGFAYEAKFDEISYMSCANLKGLDDSGTYFSFRAGAYKNTGVRLRSGYLDAITNVGVPVIDRPSLLYVGSVNSQVSMQAALRSKNNLQNVYTAAGGSGREGMDYDNFMVDLGTEKNSELLFKSNNYIRFISTGDPAGAHMEASLFLGDSGSVVTFLRQFLAADGLFSLSFSKNGDKASSYALSPYTVVESGATPASTSGANDSTSVFGVGYQLRFSQPTYSVATAGVPFSVVNNVTEMDLESRKFVSGNQWTCPSNLQFMIVRQEDLGVSVNCQTLPDDPIYDSELAVARNILRVEDWFIDRGGHCVVPKKATASKCYGSAQQVDYTMAAGPSACVEGDPQKPCAAFVSICYKTK